MFFTGRSLTAADTATTEITTDNNMLNNRRFITIKLIKSVILTKFTNAI